MGCRPRRCTCGAKHSVYNGFFGTSCMQRTRGLLRVPAVPSSFGWHSARDLGSARTPARAATLLVEEGHDTGCTAINHLPTVSAERRLRICGSSIRRRFCRSNQSGTGQRMHDRGPLNWQPFATAAGHEEPDKGAMLSVGFLACRKTRGRRSDLSEYAAKSWLRGHWLMSHRSGRSMPRDARYEHARDNRLSRRGWP